MAIDSQKKAATWRGVGKFWSKFGVGYFFVLPAVILFLVFVARPFVVSFYYSLTKWDGANPVKVFVGLGNYTSLLQDEIFWLCLQHNAIWIVVASGVSISLGLFLAILIWRQPRGILFFRTVFFLPQTLGVGTLATLWVLILRPYNGLIAVIFDALDLKYSSPLGSYQAALPALLVAAVWSSVGFYFVIMVAALQNVNMELVDAAQVDGANAIQSFFYVVIPQLSHQLTLVGVLAMIGGLNTFGLIFGTTQGGPANATQVIATYAYRHFSVLSNVGYSAAITMIMAVVALGISYGFMRIRERGEV